MQLHYYLLVHWELLGQNVFLQKKQIKTNKKKLINMKISEHLDLVEVVKSATAKRKGISNMPTEKHLENLKKLATNVFEPLRKHFGVPIYISSGYRSKELNIIIGGAKNSDHCLGMAIDLDQQGKKSSVTNKQVFHFIKDNLKFKQLIWEVGTKQEPDWVHVSYEETNLKNEVLLATFVKGKMHYSKF